MKPFREWPWYPKFAVVVSLLGTGVALVERDDRTALLMALLAVSFVPEDVLTRSESILRELLWGFLGVTLWHVSSGVFSWVFLILGLVVMIHGAQTCAKILKVRICIPIGKFLRGSGL